MSRKMTSSSRSISLVDKLKLEALKQSVDDPRDGVSIWGTCGGKAVNLVRIPCMMSTGKNRSHDIRQPWNKLGIAISSLGISASTSLTIG